VLPVPELARSRLVRSAFLLALESLQGEFGQSTGDVDVVLAGFLAAEALQHGCLGSPQEVAHRRAGDTDEPGDLFGWPVMLFGEDYRVGCLHQTG